MKKFLVFSLLLFFLTACSTSNDTQSETTHDPSESSSSKWSDGEYAISVDDAGETHSEFRATLFYRSFEEILPEVTDIVIGTFNEYTTEGMIRKYDFSVERNIRGLGSEQSIIVDSLPAHCTVLDKGIEFSTYECQYQIDGHYLLLLKRSKTAYDEVDSFSFAEDSLIIRLSSSERVTSDSSLYGEALKDHIQTDALRFALQGTTFVEQLLLLVKENPFFYGENYEGTSDMKSVFHHSDFVFEVTVNSVYMETFDGAAITYTCTLDRIYKGNTEHTEILVKFPHSNDIVGETFIVAVNPTEEGSSFYVMSSPYSIFEASEREAILALMSVDN